MTIADVIRGETVKILSSPGLTDYVPGVVQSASPLQIKTEAFTLEREDLILLDGAPPLAEGDAAVLLKVGRGQKYILLGKLAAEA